MKIWAARQISQRSSSRKICRPGYPLLSFCQRFCQRKKGYPLLSLLREPAPNHHFSVRYFQYRFGTCWMWSLVFFFFVVEFFLVLVKIQFFIGIKEFAVFQIIEQSVMSSQIINHPFLVCISVFEMFSD